MPGLRTRVARLGWRCRWRWVRRWRNRISECSAYPHRGSLASEEHSAWLKIDQTPPFAAYIYVMRRTLLMHEGVGGIRVLQNFFGEDNFPGRGDNVGLLYLTIAESKCQVMRERRAGIATRVTGRSQDRPPKTFGACEERYLF